MQQEFLLPINTCLCGVRQGSVLGPLLLSCMCVCVCVTIILIINVIIGGQHDEHALAFLVACHCCLHYLYMYSIILTLWQIKYVCICMYTTPLSILISCLSLNYHLYADDTRLFFFFYPSSPSIHQISTPISITSWITACQSSHSQLF